MAGPSAKIAPSVLASDFGKLAAECTRMIKDGADWLHMGMCVEMAQTMPFPCADLGIVRVHPHIADAGLLSRHSVSVQPDVEKMSWTGELIGLSAQKRLLGTGLQLSATDRAIDTMHSSSNVAILQQPLCAQYHDRCADAAHLYHH